MVDIKFASEVETYLVKLKRKDKKLFSRIDKQLFLFAQNPKHPSLRTHKLSGRMKNVWSISVNMSIRMVYLKINKDSYVFVKIGTHEEIYK